MTVRIASPQQSADEQHYTPGDGEIRALLAEYGIALSPWRIADSKEAAIAAATCVGMPVALKTAAGDIVHKSDAGCVRLHLATPDEVENAWHEVISNACWAGSALPQRVLVERMVDGIAEVVIGIKRSDTFGAVLLVGTGGIWVEIMRDYALRLCPVDKAEASDMLRELQGWPMLSGDRGRQPCDLDALTAMIVAASHLGVERDDLVELDLNPVVAREKGHGAVAVDARAVLSGGRTNQTAASTF